MGDLADKVKAKEIVARKLGASWITPNLYVGDNLPPLAERTWAAPYVVKANQGSGSNIFVNRGEEPDWPKIDNRLNRWLANPHGRFKGEWAYGQITPKVLVEPSIGDNPADYKLFVFGGRVEFIQVHVDRFTDHKCAFYDRHWVLQPFTMKWPRETRLLPRPASLEEMVVGAEVLAAGFPFMRVDLYQINGAPRFGEVTFYPESGLARIDPPEFDRALGDLWPTGRPTV